MKSTKVTLGAAGAGVLAGVVGLAVLAVPAGAGPAPSLPQVTPKALVQSTLTAQPAAWGGTVALQNHLGLPSIPNVPGIGDGTTTARVYSDGKGDARISYAQEQRSRTVVKTGEALWTYDSSGRSATKYPLPAKAEHRATIDPATVARNLVAKLRTSSTVSVNGTARVAGRDAYELVLRPKPSEHTLLRQVRVAIDAELRMPLRLDVYGNGSPDPVLRIGFTSLNVGPQDPDLFTFTPPRGAQVTVEKLHADQEGKARAGKHSTPASGLAGKILGEGWDTVVTSKLPAQVLAGGSDDAAGASDPMKLLSRVGKRVSGPWGDGWVVSTKVATVLVTSDGRFAAGFVPTQQLTSALSTG